MGYVFIIAAALLWGSLGPVARFALEAGIDPLEVSFWRAALAGVLYALHALARRCLHVARRDLPAVVVFALLGVSLFYWSYMRAVQEGGAALASILLYTAPAWVAVASALWLHERMTARKVAAIVLTLAGMVLIATAAGGGNAGEVPVGGTLASFGAEHSARVSVMAIVWGLVAGLTYATYYLFGKRYFARYDAATLLALALPLGALALLPAVRFADKAPADWLVLAYLAVVPTYLAYLLYGLALQRIEATRAATAATVEPVAAALLAYVVWGEALGVAAYVGAGLVLGGVVMVATSGR